MHLESQRIQRLRHGELTPDLEAEARAHLASCEECRRAEAELAEEEANLFALLTTLDDTPPQVSAADLVARAAAGQRDTRDPRDARDTRTSLRGGRVIPSAGRFAPQSWSPRLRWAAAAAVVILLGGAVYAAPGSPVRAWVGTVLEKLNRSPRPPIVAEVKPSPRPPSVTPGDVEESGIAVEPGQSLAISFAAIEESCQVRVSLTEESEVTVRAPSNLGAFTSDLGHLRIKNGPGKGTFQIQIPRQAPHVTIDVAGHRLFEKNGAQVVTTWSPDNAGRYQFTLKP